MALKIVLGVNLRKSDRYLLGQTLPSLSIWTCLWLYFEVARLRLRKVLEVEGSRKCLLLQLWRWVWRKRNLLAQIVYPHPLHPHHLAIPTTSVLPLSNSFLIQSLKLEDYWLRSSSSSSTMKENWGDSESKKKAWSYYQESHCQGLRLLLIGGRRRGRTMTRMQPINRLLLN
jgi:hypothetical protein